MANDPTRARPPLTETGPARPEPVRLDPAELSPRSTYFAMISTIVPRPIALVTTVNREGVVNVAPFSFFNGVSSTPPLVSICIGHRRHEGQWMKKDTLRNIEATGECVVHIPSEGLAEQVNQSAAEYPPDVSELPDLGLRVEPSDLVAPPRLIDCPIAMECKLDRVIMLGRAPARTGMVIAEIVRFHIDPGVWDARGQVVEVEKLLPLSRLGGSWYGRTRAPFSLPRPDWEARGVVDRPRGE